MREILDRITAVGKDAREARDATIALNARLTAENTQEQIAKIWARIEASDSTYRSDLLNTSARIGERIGKHEGRTADLEAWRQRIEGANGLVKFLSRYSPWLVTAAAAVYAYVHGGGKMP